MAALNATALFILIPIFVNVVYCSSHFDTASWFPKEPVVRTDNYLPTEEWKAGDFRMYEKLGEGGFGIVWSAMSRKDKNMYAIKKIPIATTSTMVEIRNEIVLQRKLKSKFVIQLYNVFKDHSVYYLQLELAEGGELFDLMYSIKRPFSEDTARFYAAEILCALEYIHNNDIIFRDLKPENILLTKSGHIKIADFGIAKEIGSEEKATGYSGSPEYKAPEVVMGEPYNKTLDSWSLGLIIYVMLTRHHPFYAKNTFRICENILHAKIIYGRTYFSMDAEDLLKNLLDRNPKTRYNISQTKGHKWFVAEDKINWTKVENQEYIPPFSPQGNRYYYTENNKAKFFNKVNYEEENML